MTIAFLGLFLAVALGLEAFGGAFYAAVQHTKQREDAVTRQINQQKQVAQGVVTQVDQEKLKASSVRYAVTYQFSLPSGQRFTGNHMFNQQNDFAPGQTITVEYAAQDPMLNRLPGESTSQSKTDLVVNIFALAWLALLPLMALFSGLRRSPRTLPVRLGFVVFMGLAALVGYARGWKWMGGNAHPKSYTVQIGTTVLTGAQISCSGKGASVTLDDDGLQVNGIRYPMPPDHAHIWVKKGAVLVNNHPWPL